MNASASVMSPAIQAPVGWKRFTRIVAGGLGLLAILWNLRDLWTDARDLYAAPAAERALLGQHHMEDMISLIRALPDQRGDPPLVGVWYPFDDPVTTNQLGMVIGYPTFPARITPARADNLDRLDAVAAYRSHAEEFQDLLTEQGRSGAFRPAGENGKFVLYARPGIAIGSFSPGSTPAAPSAAERWGRSLRLIAALAALLPIGWILTRSLVSNALPRSRPDRWLIAWIVGASWLVFCLTTVGMTGIPLAACLATAAAVPAAVAVLNRRRIFTREPERPAGDDVEDAPGDRSWRSPRGILRALLVLLAVVWASLILFNALGAPTSDMTGLGVWGFKAKAFSEAGRIDFGLLGDPDRPYIHPRYPLGFPLFLTYGYFGMGVVDDWSVKLAPALCGIGVCALLNSLMRSLRIDPVGSLLLAVLFSSGAVFSAQSAFLEAETLLLLFAVSGYGFLSLFLADGGISRLRLGAWLLIASAAIKQEGAVFAVVGLGTVAILSRGLSGGDGRKIPAREFVIIGASFLLVAAPWYVYGAAQGMPGGDFGWSIPRSRTFGQNAAVLAGGYRSFLELMYTNISSVAGLWTAGTVVLLVLWRRMWERRHLRFLGISAVSLVVLFGSVYLFSIYPEDRMDWHMLANKRLLLLPTALMTMLVGSLACSDVSDTATGGRVPA